jgi:hypothetical protein
VVMVFWQKKDTPHNLHVSCKHVLARYRAMWYAAAGTLCLCHCTFLATLPHPM